MQSDLKTPDRTVRTLALSLICLGFLFSMVGCAQFYKMLGLTEKQTTDQVSEDQKVIIQAISEIRDTAADQATETQKVIIRTISEVRTTAADIVSVSAAALGTLASGLLARWLGTERKITKALIVGIENAPASDAKASIKSVAISAGVEKALHKRVASLT